MSIFPPLFKPPSILLKKKCLCINTTTTIITTTTTIKKNQINSPGIIINKKIDYFINKFNRKNNIVCYYTLKCGS